MKNKLLATILLLSLFTSILTIGLNMPSVNADPTTTLRINPSLVEKDPSDFCSYFNVSVMIDDVVDLFGFDIKITWDSSLLTFHKLHNYTLDTIWTSGWFDIWPPSTGAGWVKYVAVGFDPSSFSGNNGELFILEFHVEHGCNFDRETSIHFEAVKLSNSNWTEITASLVDGLYKMSATVPDLEFALKTNKTGEWVYIDISDPGVPPPEFEYCDWFEVEVWVSHICCGSPLTDYHLKIKFDPTLVLFFDVDYWDIFGEGIVVYTAGGDVIEVSGAAQTAADYWCGELGLLFALTFHVEFDCTEGVHIWKCPAGCPDWQNFKGFQIEIVYAALSFTEGRWINMDGIDIPPPLLIQINFIQGDVNCDGKVNIKDLRVIAVHYDKKEGDMNWTTVEKYDLNCDKIIDIFDLVIVASNYGYQ